LRARFEADYARLYGAGAITLGTPVEIVALRAVGTGPAAALPASKSGETGIAVTALAPACKRLVRSGSDAEARIEAGIFDDAELRPGQLVQGPALIERWDTSIWVPEAVTASRDGMGSIVLEVL